MNNSEWLNLGGDDSADVLDDACEGQGPSVDADGTFGADERRGFTLAVEFVAFGDRVGLAVLRTACGTSGFVGKQEEAEVCVGENDGADVAAFHDQPSEFGVIASDLSLAALIVEQEFADRFDRGKLGDVGIDLGGADVGIGGHMAVDTKQCAATFDGGVECQRCQ